MPTPTHRARSAAPALLGVLVCAFTFTSLAEAKPKSVPADLRVVSPTGRSLADGTQFTTGVTIKTDRRADCFGPGTGGSGARVGVPGATALGQLAHGAAVFGGLDPISTTDSFPFGLGLCGIGRSVAPSTGYWYLKVDHSASFTGADQTIVERGSEILWFLIEDFSAPTPDELRLKAPAGVEPGEAARVKVTSYADDGTRSPAAGVTVSGAATATDASGRTTVTVGDGVSRIRATREGSIPSNMVVLCTDRPAECPAGYATTIGGTSRADRIRGGAAAETIVSGPGKDVIDARRGGGRDKVNCGPGRDELVLAKGSRSKFRSCERVSRR